MGKGLGLSIMICAAFIVGGASATFAGEITGTGKSLKLPGGGLHGASDCAFSGLEDSPFGPGTVQSFGKHPNDAFGNGGVSDDRDNIPNHPGPAAPGVACNPSDPQNEPS